MPALGIALLVLLLAGGAAVIPRVAAATADDRICAGVTAGASFTGPDSAATFTVYVPARATLHIEGSADILGRDTTGGWQTILSIDPAVYTLLGEYYDGPYTGRTFAGSWTQGEVSGDVTLLAHQQYGTTVNFRFTATVIGSADTDVNCAPTQPAPSSTPGPGTGPITLPGTSASAGVSPSTSSATPAAKITGIVATAVTPDTPLYQLPLQIDVTGVRCPASLRMSLGRIGQALVRQTVPLCSAGQPAPTRIVTHLPVFDPRTGASAMPDARNNLSAVLDGGGAYQTEVRLPPAPRWVGAGDSYSSGHHQDSSRLISLCRLDVVQAAVDKVYQEKCRTHPNDEAFSWVTRAAKVLNARLTVPKAWQMKSFVVARSGAATADYAKTTGPYDHGQVALASRYLEEVSTSWNVFSVSGGANDGDYTFVDALHAWYQNAIIRGSNPYEPWKGNWSRKCPNVEGIYQNAKREADTIRRSLTNAITAAQQASPGTRIVDMSYPDVLPVKHSCAVDHPGYHGTNITIAVLDDLHASLTAPGMVHVDLRGQLTFDDIQQTMFLGYPHPTRTGQDKMAFLAARALVPDRR